MSHAHNTTQPGYIAGTTHFVRSYAKINLALDVLGKRADGYHDLVTVMQTIDLYDTICLSTIEENAVHLICSRPELNNDSHLHRVS
jgi:4-diphosphocytidyl-2-C-methyl-D-erythritol kinase